MLLLLAFNYGISWVATHGSFNCIFLDMVLTRDGVVVTGCTGTATGMYALVEKFDYDGNPVWVDSFTPQLFSFSTYGEFICLDSTGVLHILGTYQSDWGVFKHFLAEYDTLGNRLSLDTFPRDVKYSGMMCDSSGNLFLVGTTLDSNDVIIEKRTPDWTLIWRDTICKGEGGGLALTSTYSCYAGGKFGDGEGYFITKYSPDGISLWMDTVAVTVTNPPDVAIYPGEYVLELGEAGLGVWTSTGTRLYFYPSITGEEVASLENSILCGRNGVYVDVYSLPGIYLGRGVYYEGEVDIPLHEVLSYEDGFFICGDGLGNGYLVYFVPFDAAVDSILSPPDTLYNPDTITPIVSLSSNVLSFDTLSLSCTIAPSSMDTLLYCCDTFVVFDTTFILFTFPDWPVTFADTLYTLTVNLVSNDTVISNNLLSKDFVIVDTIPPHADSAVASDGSVVQSGVDTDDIVAIYFSESMSGDISPESLDYALTPSGGHTWGTVDSVKWNDEKTVLYIFLEDSSTTIVPGDTIYPDGTLKDIFGNPWTTPVVLGGSFGPEGVERTFVNGLYYTRKSAGYTCISVYDVTGRKVFEKVKFEEPGRYKLTLPLPPGVYYAVIEGERKEKTRILILK
ncbi:hypothetical protein DRQ20_01835 [bacterium]|nr:MAG: hypothetical protein DRQ20_01835 [bacterium]